MSKSSKKYSVLSLICSILSCFYTVTFILGILLTELARVMNPEYQTVQQENFLYFILVLIFIVAILSLVFAHISIKRGVNIKITSVSKILSVISIAVSAISALIMVMVSRNI